MIESIDLKFRYPLSRLDSDKVKYIVIHHPGAITASVQDIHRWHLNNGWSGIGYNEYITKNGKIYLGRGDNIGAHCADSVTNYNPISYGICAEGDYNREKVMPEKQFQALIQRIKVAQYKFTNAIIVPHKQLTATSCPGKYFPWERMITELTLPILKIRSTGDAVKVLQRKLIQHGYFIGFVDGIFGLLTRRAVVKFQRKNGLIADAIVGPRTWSKLNSK